MTRRLAFCMAICTPLLAWETQPLSRRATMTGSRGDRGKCTIEVVVDDVAEIEIQGDSGLLHTLSGQPSSWVRFEFSDLLPPLPDGFKFTGVDGPRRPF